MTTVAAQPTALSDKVSVLGRQLEYKYVVAIIYVTALFLDILDVTIVNVAIPALGQELNSGDAEWVILGYTLSLAVWIPASGWLGDRIGTKRTFMFAFLAFTLGSLLCATAQTMGQLIAFRVIQGIGGGMLTPVGVAMLFRAFPPAERARASTIIMLPTMLAPAMGPILGGLLVTHANWRWIFLVNVPIGVIGIAFGVKYLREHREPSAGKFDIPGFVLSAAALALIVYALSDGPRHGWTSRTVVATAATGVVCAVLVVWVEGRVERPLLALRLLHNRIFRQCNVLSLLSTMSFLGLTFVMPLYLQLFRGLDALESGLTTFPQALGILISAQVAGRLYMRVGPRRLITGGLFAAGFVILAFVRIEIDTDLWQIRGLMFLRGLCMGFAFVPMQAASYATIDPKDNGRASSIFSVQRQVGVSLGVAILASVLASYMSLSQAVSPDLPASEVADILYGYHVAFALAVGFTWAAAIAAFFIRDSDAAPTMRPRHTAPARA